MEATDLRCADPAALDPEAIEAADLSRDDAFAAWCDERRDAWMTELDELPY